LRCHPPHHAGIDAKFYRYPGCACDIPSASYQFTWERNPYWSQYYSESPEIWRYFKDTVEKHGLMKYIKLDHSVTGAYWQPEEGLWEVHVQRRDGSTFVDRCHVLVNGGGVLKYNPRSRLVQFN
jgi:cation diffusion facilitator CzcD-associated flavoprotein CzcO